MATYVVDTSVVIQRFIIEQYTGAGIVGADASRRSVIYS